jgi:IS1 family transposase
MLFSSIMFSMNKLSTAKRVQILSALVEGNSLRSTSRMVGCSINTVTKLLVDLGHACAKYQDKALRNLPCRRIQCDEIWSFCYSKAKNVPLDKQGQFGVGDVWTWTAICADTKLIPTWYTGDRGADSAWDFMQDLSGRLANRVQLTTDGHGVYLNAVDEAFRGQVDYAQLVKIYGKDNSEPDTRYSPAKCNGAKKEARFGNPDQAHISTSYVERANLTMRMGDAPFHAPNERLLEEGREPRARRGDPHDALQLRQNPQVAPRHPGDGSGRLGSRLDLGRDCWAPGLRAFRFAGVQ